MALGRQEMVMRAEDAIRLNEARVAFYTAEAAMRGVPVETLMPDPGTTFELNAQGRVLPQPSDAMHWQASNADTGTMPPTFL
jgi:hypothetical protein